MSWEHNKPRQPEIEKLAYTREETLAAFGNISSVTLWRYCKRGLIAAVPGTNGRLYSKKAIQAFLERGAA